MYSISPMWAHTFRQASSGTVPCNVSMWAFRLFSTAAAAPHVEQHTVENPLQRAFLSDDQKKQMRELRQKDPQKYTQRALARMFNVSRLIVARYAKAPPAKKQEHAQWIENITKSKQEAVTRRKGTLTAWLKKHQEKEYQQWGEKVKQREVNKRLAAEKIESNEAARQARRQVILEKQQRLKQEQDIAREKKEKLQEQQQQEYKQYREAQKQAEASKKELGAVAEPQPKKNPGKNAQKVSGKKVDKKGTKKAAKK